MKRIVITFGLIGGGIAALLMFATLPLVNRVSYEYLTVLGYTVFVACFLTVYFGLRSYRDTIGGGTITFGRAFKVGILITLIACGIYMFAWDFIYQQFLPTFFAKRNQAQPFASWLSRSSIRPKSFRMSAMRSRSS